MLEYVVMSFGFNARNKFLTTKLLKQGYRYNKLRNQVFDFDSLIDYIGNKYEFLNKIWPLVQDL